MTEYHTSTPLYKNILIPVDGSKYSQEAARQGLELAKIFNANVLLLHVISKNAIDHYVIFSGKSMEEVKDQLVNIVDKYFENPLKLAKEMGVSIKKEIRFGNIPLTIVATAAEGYDLIVIGLHGMNASSGILLGSNAEAVARLAKCPVLIAKTK